MANCGQACPYNTLDGCKVKEYNAICPLTNMATPVTEYRMTNADRIRAMTDEELEKFIRTVANKGWLQIGLSDVLHWLQQSAEGE